MTDGQVLEFSHATKRFGVLTAVDDLSARIEPGAVTAFLGPNGAGKTTSLRMMIGQIRPTSGTATIGGVAHSELRHPLRTIGSVLEEAVYRPRRTAPRQLTIAAKANGIPLSRVQEVLELVGLQNETETRIGAYSLGMRQRLSVAGALLGDPGALVLDEPANGLDPEGIRWMRLLMRQLADEGRTVLVSSHVLSEIEQIADNVLVLSKGRLVYADSIGKLSDPTTGSVVVDADDRAALAASLQNAGLSFDVLRSGLTVHNTDAAAVGAVAASAGLALTTLLQRGPSLEEVFLDLVHGRRDSATGAMPVVGAPEAATEAPVTADSASTADASDESAEAPATADGIPSAGLFGAAAAVPVVAAASAGVAGLFDAAGAAAPAEGAAAVPTTRREAAEFAAAQSAADENENAGGSEDEGSEDEGSETAGTDTEGAESESAETAIDGGEGVPEDEAPATDENDAESADEASDSDSDSDSEENGSQEDGSDEGASDEGVSAQDGSDQDGSDQAGSDQGEEEADASGTDASGENGSAKGDTDTDVQADEGEQDQSESESTEDAEAETGVEDQAERTDEDSASSEDAHDDTAIAAGVALTAPIDADYTPGDAAQDSADEARQDEDSDEHEAPLTHAADAGEEGSAALGSFETAALTIPDAAPVSFDDLITGVPSAPQTSDVETAEGEDHSESQEPDADDRDDRIDDAPTAATTVITTPSADDEFATPEPSTETTEIAGIEIFAALAEGRTQEIQVILDESPDDDDDLEDVTQGEIDQHEDPRAAAVSASLAAAARAFFTDDAPSYTPGPAGDEESAEQSAAHDESAPQDDQQRDGSQHEQSQDEQNHDEQNHDGERHDGDHHGH